MCLIDDNKPGCFFSSSISCLEYYSTYLSDEFAIEIVVIGYFNKRSSECT